MLVMWYWIKNKEQILTFKSKINVQVILTK